MVVGRVLVHGDQCGDRQERVALEKVPGVGIEFPQSNLVVKNFGGLEELGPALGQPQRHPFAGAA